MELPECSICLCEFNGKQNYPRVLSCGHSLCTSCIQEVISPQNDEKRVVKCPECSWKTTLDVRGLYALPKNIELMRLMESMQGKVHASLNLAVTVVETAETPVLNIDNLNEISAKNCIDSLNVEVKPFSRECRAIAAHMNQAAAVIPFGNRLYSASYDRSVKIWDLETGNLLHTLDKHQSRVNSLAMAKGGEWLISADNDAKIIVWSLDNSLTGVEPPQVVKSWKDHDDWRFFGVTALAVSNSQILFTGGGDRTVKAWSLEDFSILSTMAGHSSAISALLCVEENVFSASWDGTVRVWKLNGTPLHTYSCGLTGNLVSVRCLSFVDGVLFCGLDDGCIQLWKDNKCQLKLPAHKSTVSSIFADFNFIYSGDWKGNIQVHKNRSLDAVSGLEIAWEAELSFTGHEGAVNSIICLEDRMFTCGSDGKVKIWEHP